MIIVVCVYYVFLLDMMPQSDLLTPVIGPIPMQNGIGTDNMLHPLSYLLDHSISLPLLTQSVSQVII